MSDTYSVKITATDSASPVFRSLGAEAKKTDSILDGIGDGALKALQAIERNTAEAAESLRDFGKASQEAEQKSRSLGQNLDKIGAGAGVLVGALSGLGQAYQTQERGITAVTRLYGENASAMLEYAEYLQQTTTFSDDAARAALTLTGSLQNSYGFQAEQIQNLISIGADYAALYGVDLPDAVQSLTAAMRGEAEAAEALGLTLSDSQVAAYAASIGITNYSTGLDEAGRAQVRYQLLLEQSAVVQGTAAERAETLGGGVRQLMNQFQDAGQAVGGFLGPVGEVLAVLGPSALALPLVGAGLGTVATGARAAGTALAAARISALGFSVALGPIGLAAVAIGAAALAFKAINDSADSAREATEGLGAALAGALQSTTFGPDTFADISSGISDALALEIAELNSNNTGGGFSLSGLAGSLSSSLVDAFSDNPELTALSTQLTDIVNYAFNSGAVNAGAVVDELFNLNTALSTGAIQLPEYRAGVESLAGSLASFGVLTIDGAGNVVILGQSLSAAAASLVDFAAAGESADAMLKSLSATAEFYGTSLLTAIDAQIALLNAQAYQQLIAGDEAYRQTMAESLALETAAVPLRRKAAEENVATVESAGSAIVAAVGEQVEAERAANIAILDVYRERKNASRAAALEAQQARAQSAAEIAATYRSALGQTSDAPFLEGLDEMVAVGDLSEEQATRIRSAFDALEASGASTIEIIVGLTDALGYGGTAALGFAASLYGAVDATDGVLGLYGAIDNLGNRLSSADTIASELFGEGGDAFDGLGPLAEMLANGTISQEQFNEAVAAGTQIQADNIRGQESLNAVRANLLPLLADQTTELANYYQTLSGLSDAEQQRALYLGDTANQQQVLTLANAAYAASIGQIPPEAVTTLIADAANADPILKGVLEDMELITVGADGTITVNFPNGESLPATITTLNGTLETLTSVLAELAGIPDPFATTASGADAATISTDALTESTRALWAQLGAPIPPPPVGTQARAGIGLDDGGGGGTGRYGGGLITDDPTLTGTDIGGVPRQLHLQVKVDDTQVGPVLDEIEGNITVLGENGTVYLGADADAALAAIDDATGAVEIYDTSTGTTYLYANDEASPTIREGQELLKATDGSRAVLFLEGDNRSALETAFAAGSTFDGINGKSALLFANGDSSGAEQAAGAAGAAIAGVDGTTGNVYVQGNDNYSGVVQAARNLGGSILGTAYFDVVTREYTQKINSYFADGGIVPYADGGVIPTAANSRVLVGENGPEIATLPGGTLITPSPASQQLADRMMGGGGLNVNVYMQGTYIGIDDFMGDIAAGINRAVDMQDASLGGA